MDRASQVAMIGRHIAQSERHISSQRSVVERLRELGADTALAEELLEEFESMLAQHRMHLQRLNDESPGRYV